MRSTSPAIQPKPSRHLVFAPALGHELHADANAEKRPAARAHALIERLHHAGDGVEPAPAIGESADARQHDAIGAPDRVGIGVTMIGWASPSSRAARSNAFAAECRLPEP